MINANYDSEIDPIEKEYGRWKSLIGRADPYVGKTTIGIHEVLQAHFLLVKFFHEKGEGIGGIGPKNIDLLHSALSRQIIEFGGKPKWSERIDVCATLLFGLVKNHPFYDANKRTAFLTSILHLQKIGRTPTIHDVDYENFIVDIADNNLKKYINSTDILIDDQDKEIKIISRFLKKSTRNIDLRSKIITYNQLNSILQKRGYILDNPKGNRIDLIRIEDYERKKFANPKKIAHVGFHGWSREASMKVIDQIREVTKLDASHGYDTQAFFNGLEDPLSLIKKYKEPLERLAFR